MKLYPEIFYLVRISRDVMKDARPYNLEVNMWANTDIYLKEYLPNVPETSTRKMASHIKAYFEIAREWKTFCNVGTNLYDTDFQSFTNQTKNDKYIDHKYIVCSILSGSFNNENNDLKSIFTQIKNIAALYIKDNPLNLSNEGLKFLISKRKEYILDKLNSMPDELEATMEKKAMNYNSPFATPFVYKETTSHGPFHFTTPDEIKKIAFKNQLNAQLPDNQEKNKTPKI